MASPVIPTTQSIDLATLMQTDWATAKAHAFTANANPVGPRSVLADFTEATYTGYASVSITTWGGPFGDVNGQAVITSGSLLFPGPSSGSGQNILGLFFTDSAGTELLAAVLFDSAVPLNTALDFMACYLQIGPGGNGSIQVTGSFNP